MRKRRSYVVEYLSRSLSLLSTGGGYDVTGFADRDFNDVLGIDSPPTRGFYIWLRLKFDERAFGQRLSSHC